MISKRAYARIGLMGNPSDGFYGKTLSCCISNFHAEVLLTESHRLRILPHNVHDITEFSSLEELTSISSRYGYYGGLRLIYATCKRFSEYCKEMGISLGGGNFTIRYDTDVPRQVGLGGSSAIIVAVVKALMEFYGLTVEDIPLEIQPNLVLSVETNELGITAGLQDRVVQTYGGTVFMNFDKASMRNLGHGTYVRIDSKLLPALFLAYADSPGKESGKMHNEIRFRFNQGDPAVLSAMCTFADYASEAEQVLKAGDITRFGKLMNANFDLRRKIYGADLIGAENLRMVQIARELDAPVKFPGSGGAIVGICFSHEHYNKLQKAFEAAGYRFTRVTIGP